MPNCTLYGNPNIYGVGVRIAVYSVWLAQFLIVRFNSKHGEAAQIFNSGLQLSILLNMYNEPADKQIAVGSIIMQLLMCGSLTGPSGGGTSQHRTLASVARILSYTGLAAYSVWFWWDGTNNLTQQDCPPQIGFFWRIPIIEDFYQFGKLMPVASLAIAVRLIYQNLYVLVVHCLGCDKLEPCQQIGEIAEYGARYLAFLAVLMAFFVILIEYLIYINQIQDVSEIASVGQLLPMLSGTLVCIRALVMILVFSRDSESCAV